jgi:chromosome segregation ATPase
MAILARVRRLFRPESPVEIDISDRARGDVIDDGTLTTGHEDVTTNRPDAMDLLARIETRLDEGRAAQDRALAALHSLPTATEHLARLSTRQDDLLATLKELGQANRQRTDAEAAVLTRLGDLLDRESALFGLVQQQLDANHQIVEHTAGRLEQLAAAVTEASRTNRVTGEAMEAMVVEMREREKRAEDRAGAMQGWIVTCVVACIAATAAALALAWSVLERTG